MVTKIQKWGNSQGLRFPKEIMSQAHIAVGDVLNVSVDNGTIVLTPSIKTRQKHSLKTLLAKYPASLKSGEYDWGKSLGKEVW
jgi:antitoxin MazE